jgi:hypothetical protein
MSQLRHMDGTVCVRTCRVAVHIKDNNRVKPRRGTTTGEAHGWCRGGQCAGVCVSRREDGGGRGRGRRSRDGAREGEEKQGRSKEGGGEAGTEGARKGERAWYTSSARRTRLLDRQNSTTDFMSSLVRTPPVGFPGLMTAMARTFLPAARAFLMDVCKSDIWAHTHKQSRGDTGGGGGGENCGMEVQEGV